MPSPRAPARNRDLQRTGAFPDPLATHGLDRPPPGLRVNWQPARLEVVLAPPRLARILVAFVWLAGTGLLGIDRVAPGLLDLRLTTDIPWPWLAAGWLALTVGLGLWWVTRTEIEVTGREVRVRHRPWHLPPDLGVPLAHVRDAELETRCVRDRHGHETFTFEVLLARFDTHRHPCLLRTGNEGLALYLRRVLHAYLETKRAPPA